MFDKEKKHIDHSLPRNRIHSCVYSEDSSKLTIVFVIATNIKWQVSNWTDCTFKLNCYKFHSKLESW